MIGALLHVLPVPVVIAISVLVAILVIIGVAAAIASSAAKRREEERRRRAREVERQRREAANQKKQQLEHRAATLRAAKRKLEEQARLDDKQRLDVLGKQGAALLKRATSTAERIVSTEAARTGWLGDVDFAPDIQDIEANLVRARALRGKADELSALPKPDDDDRRIIADAKTTIAHLERKSKERVDLLEKCASEACLIDESLRRERDDARLAVKRDELHGELTAMLYEAEASRATRAESAADAVMARVQAYRNIKGEIERARDDTEAPPGTGGDTDDSSVPWIASPMRQAWKWVSE